MDLELGLSLESIVEPRFDQPDGQMSDVDADPLPIHLLRRVNGGAAAAKLVEDNVAFVGGGGEDAFHECDRFLGGVAKAFF